MEKPVQNNTQHSLSHWYTFRLKLVFEGIIIGAATGVLILIYRLALEKARELSLQIYSVLSDAPQFIPVWIIALISIGWLIGRLLKFEPMIGGSGIPQVEGILQGKLSASWWKVILAKLIGGTLAVGAGLSLGREGPSVQLGSAVGQGFGKIFKRIKLEEKFLMTSGASAGLAAAFNAPLAGVMFALEEVHKNFSPLVLLSSLASALTANYVASGFFGLEPVLAYPNSQEVPLRDYLYILILGAIIGILGVAFNKSILFTQTLYNRIRKIPKEFRVIIPLLLSIPFGLFIPQVLGGGHEIIVSLLAENQTLSFLLILFIAKFFFTMLSYGSGAPGGIFLPLLSMGAVIGGVYGLILVQAFGADKSLVGTFVVLAMAGYFTAIVRAPITGIILITEMTGSFHYLLPLAVVSITAYLVADVMGEKPIYESLLERLLHKADDSGTIGDKKHKTILEFCVCMGSHLDGQRIRDVSWPKHSLLVAVKRGEQEIIPKGETVIEAGDYLIVLTNDDQVSYINDSLSILVSCEAESTVPSSLTDRTENK